MCLTEKRVQGGSTTTKSHHFQQKIKDDYSFEAVKTLKYKFGLLESGFLDPRVAGDL